MWMWVKYFFCFVYQTSVFTPVLGSCTSVTVDGSLTSDDVIVTLLDKFKVCWLLLTCPTLEVLYSSILVELPVRGNVPVFMTWKTFSFFKSLILTSQPSLSSSLSSSLSLCLSWARRAEKQKSKMTHFPWSDRTEIWHTDPSNLTMHRIKISDRSNVP